MDLGGSNTILFSMAGRTDVEDDQGTAFAPAPAPPTEVTSTSGGNSYPGFSCFTHTPFYCEENVYMLCKKLSALGLADPVVLDLFVVFISNDHRMTPLWHQKASKSPDGLVIWDYHVLCIQKKGEQGFAHCLTWDLDSSLPFPLGLDKYVSEAIRPMFPLTSTYRRLFRVIHAPIFLNYFASNRAHMKDPLGNWISPPPSYEPIIAQDGCQNNLQEYIGMHAVDVVTDIKALSEGLYSNKFGVLIDEAMLETFFSFVLWQ